MFQKTLALAEQLRLARIGGGAFLMPSRLLLRLSGADAFRYLNGQITRDLSRAIPGHALPACILTPKGKLCAPLLIWREDDDLMVESDSSLEEGLIARLERYIVADDVSVTLEPPRELIHVFGKLADCEPWASFSGIRVNRMGELGIDLPKDASGVASLTLLDPRVVEALRIERGIPMWGSELTEETLPPEAGLDRTHIDYDRGCYPGQETISRLKSIGKVNRLLCLLSVPEKTGIAPGHDIITGEEIVVGTITSMTPPISNEVAMPQTMAMAYLKRSVVEGDLPIYALDPLTGGKTQLSITQAISS
jgi:folate-binding protein YgfZ